MKGVVATPVRRDPTKALVRFMILGFLLLCAVCALYLFRLELWAQVWHWKNQASVEVGSHEIVVPNDWFLYGHFGVDSANLVKARFGFNWHRKIASSALISDVHAQLELSALESALQRLDKERGEEGPRQTIATKSGIIFLCGREEQIAQLFRFKGIGDAVAVECHSTSGAIAQFTGEPEDLADFYNLLAQIRKR